MQFNTIISGQEHLVRASISHSTEGQMVLSIMGSRDEREAIQNRVAQVATGLTSRPTRSVDLRESRAYEFVIEGPEDRLAQVLRSLGAGAEQINEERRIREAQRRVPGRGAFSMREIPAWERPGARRPLTRNPSQAWISPQESNREQVEGNRESGSPEAAP